MKASNLLKSTLSGMIDLFELNHDKEVTINIYLPVLEQVTISAAKEINSKIPELDNTIMDLAMEAAGQFPLLSFSDWNKQNIANGFAIPDTPKKPEEKEVSTARKRKKHSEMTFHKIRTLRKSLNLTIERVARETGLTQDLISRVERNCHKAPKATIMKLNRYYEGLIAPDATHSQKPENDGIENINNNELLNNHNNEQ